MVFSLPRDQICNNKVLKLSLPTKFDWKMQMFDRNIKCRFITIQQSLVERYPKVNIKALSEGLIREGAYSHRQMTKI